MASSSLSVSSSGSVLGSSLSVPPLAAAVLVVLFRGPWWRLRGLVVVDFLRAGLKVRPVLLLAALRGEPDFVVGLLVFFLLRRQRPRLRNTNTAWQGLQR